MASVRNTGSVESLELLTQVKSPATFTPREQANTDQASDTQSAISPQGQAFSLMAALGDAAAQINRDSTWQASAISSSNSQAVQATGSPTQAGDYQVDVSALAQAQVTASPLFSSLSTVIGLGTLHIEMGTWNASQTAFSTNPNWPKASVNFGPKDHTLEQVRDRINASGAGVVATVVSDATGSRLVLRATSTGQASGFKVTAEHPEGEGDSGPQRNPQLDALAFDPSTMDAATGSTLRQAAQDARIEVNQRPVSASDNILDDPVSGLRLQANQLTQGNSALVSVRSDTSVAAKAVAGLAGNYNQLLNQTSSNTALQGTAQDVIQTVREAFGDASANPQSRSQAKALNDLGLSLNRYGEMVIDASRLTEALTGRPTEARQVLSSLAQAVQRSASEPSAEKDTPNSDVPSPNASNVGGPRFKNRLAEQYATLQGQLSLSENAA